MAYTRDELEQMRVFPEIIERYFAHDPSCESRRHMWLGRHGGVSDLTSQQMCDGCGVVFFLEGLAWANDEEQYCACCARARGYRVTENRYGITIE